MDLVWHRGDLRTHDHPALAAAIRRGPALGLVILDPRILDATSRRRRALFYRGVRALRHAYRTRDGLLVVRRGDPAGVLRALAERTSAERVHALASFTPYGVARDAAAVDALRARSIGVRWHDGLYVHSPGTVRTSDDGVFSVFTPFFRRWQAMGTPEPLPSPGRIPAPELPSDLDPGDIPEEEPDVDLPPPGEDAALEALERFVNERLPDYDRERDRLDGGGGSRLSVWLTLGTLSARTAAARAEAAEGARGAGAARKWLAELAWRDFLADLLYHRPDMLDAAFHPRWDALDWPGGDDRFAAWKDGRTGVPAIDAAMHQLRRTGWISNRARMVAAQFLAKSMRVDWRRGERLFRRWLLDGDTASNVGNWQWAAGLGVDNAPYFRVMNPVSQARQHDPAGDWLRRWDPDSRGDPKSRDPVVDPAAGRAAYLDAAARVPKTIEAPTAPDPARPRLDLATDARLAMVPGVGTTLAGRVLDAVASRTHLSLEGIDGIGAALDGAIRRRFDPGP